MLIGKKKVKAPQVAVGLHLLQVNQVRGVATEVRMEANQAKKVVDTLLASQGSQARAKVRNRRGPNLRVPRVPRLGLQTRGALVMMDGLEMVGQHLKLLLPLSVKSQA